MSENSAPVDHETVQRALQIIPLDPFTAFVRHVFNQLESECQQNQNGPHSRDLVARDLLLELGYSELDVAVMLRSRTDEVFFVPDRQRVYFPGWSERSSKFNTPVWAFHNQIVHCYTGVDACWVDVDAHYVDVRPVCSNNVAHFIQGISRSTIERAKTTRGGRFCLKCANKILQNPQDFENIE